MANRRFAAAVLLSTGLTLTFSAQEPVDEDVNSRIRTEGLGRSQVMRTLHFLTDVYGPRLTGSPSLRAAGEWSLKTMDGWGLKNAHLEPWEFGHSGWQNEVAWGAVVSPVKDALVFEVLAWTPGTKGPVRAKAVNIQVPDGPTAEELTAFFASTRELVKGAIVLVGRPRLVPVNITPPAKRRAEADLEAQYDPNGAGVARGGGRRGAPLASPRPGALTTSEAGARVSQFLVDSGALVRVNDAARELGQITAFHNSTYDLTKTVPTVVMRNEDYGRIARILGDGASVELEFNIVNRTFQEGRTAYNTVAEIPGSDRKEEVVMIGAHLDSWHSATGATDNAVGCAVMMEAARILNAIGAHPRRTVRVALWSGEEEGLLGSKAYVKEHFGSFEDQKPEFEKLVAYMNLDGGTGQLRGASVFGPASAAATLRGILAPFRDFGVWGTTATASRALGGTDSTSFNQAGLPGINFQQDPIEYNTHTHHTNLDTYERVIEEDVKKAAVIVASAAYHLAMRDEMLTRFAPADMPPSPASRTSSSGKPD